MEFYYVINEAIHYLFGSGLGATVGGGDNQPGGGCGGIGVDISGGGGGRENKFRDTGGGGLEGGGAAAGVLGSREMTFRSGKWLPGSREMTSRLGGPLEDGGGAKGLLSFCPISITLPLPSPQPPPSLLTESMSFIPATKFNLWNVGEIERDL